MQCQSACKDHEVYWSRPHVQVRTFKQKALVLAELNNFIQGPGACINKTILMCPEPA